MLKQNKNYELDFFNSLASEGHYEIWGDNFYRDFFQILENVGFQPSGKIIECGCGTGAFGKRFLGRYATIDKIYGVDLSAEIIAACAAQNIPRYHPMSGDLENPDLFPKNHFQGAICPFVLHHFPDIDVVMTNLGKWLAPNASLLLVEPNGDSPIHRISKFIRRLCEKIFGADWVMRKRLATPNETNHSIKKYSSELHKNGFKVVEVKTFTVTLQSTRPLTLASCIAFSKQILILTLDKILAGTRYSGSTVIIIATKI